MASFRTSFALLMLMLPVISANTDVTSLLVTSSSVHAAIVTPMESRLKEHEPGALLEADARVQHEKGSKMHDPNPAAWFGGFSQGESTYDYDATLAARSENPEINVLDGWDPPQSETPAGQRWEVRPVNWFLQSASGGNKEAWQTFSPAEREGLAGNRVQTGEWFKGKGNTLQQDYIASTALATERKGMPASWFDNEVNQLDGFGRNKLPGLGGPRNYIDWEERSVNTTLQCAKAGCIANASLLAPFNSNNETYKNCKFSISFHPTDFDDQYSGESVEWIQVNSKQVSSNCRPMSHGCNKTEERPLLSCVSELAIDHLIPQNGALAIAAKIPQVVDECPYNGNLLSAVPMVTCLVSKKPSIAQVESKPVIVKPLHTKRSCITEMPLQCATRGCAAEIAIPINTTCGHLSGLGECMLSINVSQTDYDNGDGTSELIEYIKVEGKEVASKLNPGKNPCRDIWSKSATNRSDYNFVALAAHPVNISSGRVLVEGKISRYVDECASNGFLLDARAQITCKPKPALLLSQGEVGISATSRHNLLLRGHSA